MRRRGRTGGAGALAALAALLAVPAAAPVAAAPAQLPGVLVLTTGGTIASRPGAEQLPGPALVSAVPELGRVADLEVEEVARIGSSAMTPALWLELARRVEEAFAADPGLAGVVVTHGTDSMEETAYFLHLTVDDPRPVVLTGAMRSATAVSADGPANLLAAVRTAVHPGSRGRGALVVMNDEVHSARDVRKTDDNRVDAFRSAEWGALAVVDADTLVYRRASLTATGAEGPFDVAGLDSLPRVALVADYVGADGDLVRRAVESGADGVVVQAFGGGRTSPGTTAAVVEAGRAGVPVVLASRVPEGRVMPRSVEGRPMVERGLVAAGDLPPHKARVLLALALTRTRDAGEIQRLFDRF